MPIHVIDFNEYYPILNPRPEVTGHCSLCRQILTGKFPDDFPDDWKFCCFCKMIAEYLITGKAENFHFKKVLGKITLAGK